MRLELYPTTHNPQGIHRTLIFIKCKVLHLSIYLYGIYKYHHSIEYQLKSLEF